MIKKEDLTNLPKGLLLIFLAISGGYLLETLGCRFREIMTNNMYAKYLLVFFMIYFIFY